MRSHHQTSKISTGQERADGASCMLPTYEEEMCKATILSLTS